MSKKTYTMTLANGNILKNLELNGNNYVSEVEVTTADFVGNISPILISDGTSEEVLDNMELVRIANWEDAWWILIQEKEPLPIEAKLQADITYIAMMMDIEL